MEPQDLMSKLPYMGETPATSVDVANEVAKLVGVIAAIAASRDSRVMIEALENKDSELGRNVSIQKIRLASAIESLLNHRSEEDMGSVTEIVQGIDDRFAAIGKVLDLLINDEQHDE